MVELTEVTFVFCFEAPLGDGGSWWTVVLDLPAAMTDRTERENFAHRWAEINCVEVLYIFEIA